MVIPPRKNTTPCKPVSAGAIPRIEMLRRSMRVRPNHLATMERIQARRNLVFVNGEGMKSPGDSGKPWKPCPGASGAAPTPARSGWRLAAAGGQSSATFPAGLTDFPAFAL